MLHFGSATLNMMAPHQTIHNLLPVKLPILHFWLFAFVFLIVLFRAEETEETEDRRTEEKKGCRFIIKMESNVFRFMGCL